MTSSPKPHILAINNSEDVLQLFVDLLEPEGYRVTTQPYLDKDLDAIVTMNVDLIILDYMWHSDDDGWSLLQMLQMEPRTQDIPIVLCTGAIQRVTELESHLRETGVRVIIKPFNIDELLKAISASLGEKGNPAGS